VQEILALALETSGAVGHHALALCGTNGTAEVGLARLAELALLALSSAVRERYCQPMSVCFQS
jgi:anthranilate phosphoribosyltransferase